MLFLGFSKVILLKTCDKEISIRIYVQCVLSSFEIPCKCTNFIENVGTIKVEPIFFIDTWFSRFGCVFVCKMDKNLTWKSNMETAFSLYFLIHILHYCIDFDFQLYWKIVKLNEECKKERKIVVTKYQFQ